MIWAQAAVCFLVWVGYGLWLRSQSESLRSRMRNMPRTSRVLLGSVGIIGSAMLLFGGLYGLATAGGVEAGSLKLWSWPIVAALGLGFVHMQVLGAAAMITLVQEGETAATALTSDSQDRTASTSKPSE